jgi:hypothetical protein
MTGHESIIEMRLNGFAPQSVWVHVLNADPEYFPSTHPSLNAQNGFHASIDITPKDTGALDFRCLTGLLVHLSGSNERRVLSVLKQIERAAPAGVIISLPDRVIFPAQFINQPEAA